jgi:hypothetical protein
LLNVPKSEINLQWIFLPFANALISAAEADAVDVEAVAAGAAFQAVAHVHHRFPEIRRSG